ncbi:MAG: PilN domain-containing protein [Chloroflexota bacterium]
MIRINLLPVKQLQAEVSRRRQVTIGAVILGMVLVLLAGIYFYQSHQLSELETELAGLRTELQVLNAKVKEVGDLQVKIKEARGKQKIIEDLNQKKTGPVLVMASLSRATPTSLWLTDLRETGGSVTMNGWAADNETIADFMRSLDGSKFFSNVELVESTQGTAANSALKRFALKAKVIYRPPEAPTSAGKSKAGAPAKKEEKTG